jgi:hypothetical protein
LPIIEIPAKQPGATLAIVISGDGGWAGIDKAIAAVLAERGIAVVGLDLTAMRRPSSRSCGACPQFARFASSAMTTNPLARMQPAQRCAR